MQMCSDPIPDSMSGQRITDLVNEGDALTLCLVSSWIYAFAVRSLYRDIELVLDDPDGDPDTPVPARAILLLRTIGQRHLVSGRTLFHTLVRRLSIRGNISRVFEPAPIISAANVIGRLIAFDLVRGNLAWNEALEIGLADAYLSLLVLELNQLQFLRVTARRTGTPGVTTQQVCEPGKGSGPTRSSRGTPQTTMLDSCTA
jgi:hypothetical protein